MTHQVDQRLLIEHTLNKSFQLTDQMRGFNFPSDDFQAIKRLNPEEMVPALASNPSEIITKPLYVKSWGINAL